MPTQPYYLKKERVPSVTTVLGRFKESGALMHWAYNTGRDHGAMVERGEDDPGGLYSATESACNIGTEVHAAVYDFLRGDDHPWPEEFGPEEIEQADLAFENFREWWSGSMFQMEAQEIPLVHPVLAFGGTPDAICLVNGKRVIVDWKTSKGTYPDHVLQVAAYKMLWEAEHPDKPIDGGYHLCRFDKAHGDFAHHRFGDLSEAERMFILLREAYDLDKEVKKRIR